MSQGSGTPVEIDPSTYVGLFTGGEPVPAAFSGVCGRVVRGRSEAEFGSLAFASGRRLAWVTGPEGLRTMIGRTGAEIVLGIGKDPAWLREKLAEGMRWRLIVLPQAACERADWAGVFARISSDYPEVADKLLRWRDALPDRAVATAIDPGLVTGAVKDDVAHPCHMTVERYLSSADTALNSTLR